MSKSKSSGETLYFREVPLLHTLRSSYSTIRLNLTKRQSQLRESSSAALQVARAGEWTLRCVLCSAVTPSAAPLSRCVLLWSMSFRFAKQILRCELTWRRTQTILFEGRVPLSTVVLCSKTRQVYRSTKLKTAQDRLQLCLPPSADL